MSTPVWVLLGVAAWVVLGSAVAVLVGRMIRYRDRQVPDDVRRDPACDVLPPREGSEQPSARSFEGPAVSRRYGGTPPG